MKKSEIQKDQGLRLAVEHRTEAAERMTLSEDFTDRLMERIGEQEEQKPKRRRTWLYPAIGIAASILLIFAVGTALNSQLSEKPDFVAQTDTIKAAPPTKALQIKAPSQEKAIQVDDSVKKIKERYRMLRPPKHYMAKAETETITPEPVPIDETEIAIRAAEEEMRRLEMEVMAQMQGSLQDDYVEMTHEIRERGEHMTQQATIAMSNEE